MLDRFCDYLSFTSFCAGVAFAAGNLVLGLFVVFIVGAKSALNKIVDKYLDELVIGLIGPAEIRTTMMLLGGINAISLLLNYNSVWVNNLLLIIIAVGAPIKIIMKLASAVKEVNQLQTEPDKDSWSIAGKE